MTPAQTDIPNADVAESLRTVAVNSSYKASRALSKWFKRGVRLNTEGFQSVPITELTEAVGDPEEPVAAIHLVLAGDLTGDILLAFPERLALRLVDVMIGAPEGTSKSFGELERSCLQETGNIVGSAFANSLSSWFAADVTPQSPTFVFDMAAAVIEPLLVGQASCGDEALVSKTEFEFDGEPLDWRFVLVPSIESLAFMKSKLDHDEMRMRAIQTIAINGAFDASRSMSKWLRKGVRLDTGGFERVPLNEACPGSDTDEPAVALYTRLTHQLEGHTLMMTRRSTALELVDIICRQEPGTTTELDEMSSSCLLETCNIISSALMNSWAKWLDVHTEPGPPRILVDMPEAILEALLIEQAMVGDDVYMAKTEFSVEGRRLEWAFFLLPSPSSLRLIETSCS